MTTVPGPVETCNSLVGDNMRMINELNEVKVVAADRGSEKVLHGFR